jgi:hypothetical protein
MLEPMHAELGIAQSVCKSGVSTAASAAGQTVCIHFEQLRLLSANTVEIVGINHGLFRRAIYQWMARWIALYLVIEKNGQN